ncbi:MAG: serine hydrolase domain-containing protein [Planctomycetia bacterium]
MAAARRRFLRTTSALALAALGRSSTVAWEASAPLPTVEPAAVGVDAARLHAVDALVETGLAEKRMPGCVLLCARRGQVFLRKAYGCKRLLPTVAPMTPDVVFDAASITKPAATACGFFRLVEQKKLRVDQKAAEFLPSFAQNGKDAVTLEHLLLHTSGLIPDNAVADYQAGKADAFDRIHRLKPIVPVGTRFQYSDVGFLVLGEIIEKVSGEPLDVFARKNVFEPLGLAETGYLPGPALRERAAPTEQREGRWMQGEVHDPRAYLLGGVAGHAGLFTTADDLAVLGAVLANGGERAGRTLFAKETVDQMTARRPVPTKNGTAYRAYGWDSLSAYSSNRGKNFSSAAFGHGGFTGTVFWVDPSADFVFVFLSNRVHPDGKGKINDLAGLLGETVVAAFTDR